MGIRAKEMKNWLSKRCETINAKLTGCVQRHAVFGCEKQRKSLDVNANNSQGA
jgi:hypothetical protein